MCCPFAAEMKPFATRFMLFIPLTFRTADLDAPESINAIALRLRLCISILSFFRPQLKLSWTLNAHNSLLNTSFDRAISPIGCTMASGGIQFR